MDGADIPCEVPWASPECPRNNVPVRGRMHEKRYHVASYLLAWAAGLLGALVVVKLVLRPWVIERDSWGVAEVVVFSFPSFVESFVVATLLFIILTFLKRLSFSILLGVTQLHAFWISVVLAGIHVITQELQEHNLGGANVVDRWDILASFIGLACFSVLFLRFKYWRVSDR